MDWPMFRQVERQAIRLHQMMARLNVDAVKFARMRRGEAYTEARMRCLYCGTADKCLRWLDGYGRQDQLPEFCPNLPEFEKCRKAPPATADDNEDERAFCVFPLRETHESFAPLW